MSIPSCSTHRKLGWGLVLLLLLFQFYVRYLPSPWAVFVADDWNNLARSSFYPSHTDAAIAGLQDPNRPLSMMAVEVVYRWFGDQRLYWTALSLFGNSLVLLFLMNMTMALTRDRRLAVLHGLLFCLLPNLTETYHWSTQVLNEVFCALVFYLLSGWMGVAYFRQGGRWRMVIAVLAYGMALFSYEAGILLPGALLAVVPWRRNYLRGLLALAPFAMMAVLYAAWRATDSFGLNQTWYYPPHMQAGVSLEGMAWNARQVVKMWLGDDMALAVLNGWMSFATLPPWTGRLLVLGNVVVLSGIGFLLIGRRGPGNGHESDQNPVDRGAVFYGILWAGGALAINLASYTAPRLNVLPAAGITLLVALVLRRWPARVWGPALFFPALLAMVANQGTTESYRQVGLLNRRIYSHLEEHVDSWRDKEAILFDTRALRQRLTPGLARPIGDDPATWASYQNALLLRGFVYSGMVKHILGEPNPPVRRIHDVEFGARIDGDLLRWHERYNPANAMSTPMEGVYIVDVFKQAEGIDGR